MLNDLNYKEILSGFSIVEIKGDSCTSCITMMPILQNIATSRDINLFFVDASEECKEFIEAYNVTSVPSILLLHDTELIAMARGYQPQEILEIWIDAKKEEYLSKI